jgi:hypothetical protein
MAKTKNTKSEGSKSFERQMQRNRRLIGFAFHEIEDQRIADACELADIRDSLSNGGFRGFNC